jgi:hypothetical protein
MEPGGPQGARPEKGQRGPNYPALSFSNPARRGRSEQHNRPAPALSAPTGPAHPGTGAHPFARRFTSMVLAMNTRESRIVGDMPRLSSTPRTLLGPLAHRDAHMPATRPAPPAWRLLLLVNSLPPWRAVCEIVQDSRDGWNVIQTGLGARTPAGLARSRGRFHARRRRPEKEMTPEAMNEPPGSIRFIVEAFNA